MRKSSLDTGFGEFFRYHGWLAPGIRLFRAIGFQAKAVWISAAFVLPLAVLLYYLWAQATAAITSTRSEREGLAFVRPTLELVAAAQRLRTATALRSAERSEAASRVQAAWEQVTARQAAFGKAMGTQQAFDALAKLVQAVRQLPADAPPDDALKAQDDLIEQALDLIADIADGSSLALDPDLDTYHLMNFSVLLGPRQFENLAHVTSVGALVLQTREFTPGRRDLVTTSQGLMDFLERGMEASYRRGVEAFPAVAATMDMKGTDAAAEAFANAVKTQLMGEKLAGDAAGFVALGQSAVEKQTMLVRQVMDRLDTQLDARLFRLQRDFTLQFGLSVLFVALAAYLLLAFYKVVMGGLLEVTGHLEQITQGNLTTAPTPWGKDEAAALMRTMGSMQNTLRRMVGTVIESSGQVQSASEEIAHAAQDLSARTERNAASLEQTAASMAHIAETVQRASAQVHDATDASRENAAAARRGGDVIQQVVRTMEGIRVSSSKIGEIIGVIDGIAFRTNILALNAAVEAARAGEQGRGFAVVASEVRSLAQRSAEAAKEIKALIGASISQVQAGNRVVTDAGRTIDEVVDSANHIAELMRGIANATQEQTTAVAQVSAAVTELDQSTQQNAALVEETTAASSGLSDQAQRLSDEINFFKLR